MFDTVTYVTGNPGKIWELNRYINIPVRHVDIDLDEIQSLDTMTIVEHKAREAYKHIQAPVLVEDTSLRFLALGKLPGPLIKWFLSELGTEGLCRLLDGYTDRSAIASVLFGLYDGRLFRTFAGAHPGSIAATPRGSNGFGWDTIFIPAKHDKTWAEMDDDERRQTSMRAIAISKLEAYLQAAERGQ